MSPAAAEEWLQAAFREAGGTKAAKIYYKGDFNGMLWATFSSKAERDQVLQKIWKAGGLKHAQETKIWISQDQTLEERVENSYLLGIKYLLAVSWGYGRSQAWVDTDKKRIFCGPDLVAEAHVESAGQLKVEFSSEWAAWEEFSNSPELKEIADRAKEKLNKGAGKGSEGSKCSKGKGKEKSAGKDGASY